MRIERLATTRFGLGDLVDLAVRTQAHPDTFVAYFGEDAATIEHELSDVAQVLTRTLVAFDDELHGWLTAEIDEEMRRVWWWGPVASAGPGWPAVADALLGVARREVRDLIDEEELAVDERSSSFRAFARRHDFTGEEASVLLAVSIDRAMETDPRVRAFERADAPAVGGLHDQLFPGTHSNGTRVTRPDSPDLRLVAIDRDRVIGYVVVQHEPDGSAYIDHLGVDPVARRAGVGSALVRSALAQAGESGATTAHLTVRGGNDAARRLYASLGFREVRILRPYRRGFSLD